MSIYKIVLLHRRCDGARAAFQAHWAATHTPHLQTLRAALGFQSHARVDLVPALDPLLNLIRASRSWLSVALTALEHGESVPAPEPREESWDLMEELWYPSREALVTAFAAPAGRDGFQDLTDGHEDHPNLSGASALGNTGRFPRWTTPASRDRWSFVPRCCRTASLIFG